MEWIEEPVDRQIKQGTVDEVRFTAKLSVKGKKAKWYMRNQVGSHLTSPSSTMIVENWGYDESCVTALISIV